MRRGHERAVALFALRPGERLELGRVAVHRFRDARDFHRFVNSDDLRPRQSILAARATRRRGAALLDRQPSRRLLIARAQSSGRQPPGNVNII